MIPKGSTVLVTGCHGFIGGHLCDALLACGYRVRGLDRADVSDARLEIVHGDAADIGVARKAVQGCAAVLHHAAMASVPQSIADPVAAHRDTATTTLNLLAAANDSGAKRFVLASSAAVYGDAVQLPVREDAPLEPKSPYAAAKIASEAYVSAFSRLGIDGVSLRYFNVFGPRQSPHSSYAGVITLFLKRVLAGQTLTIFGDGGQTRDFVDVADIVRANLLALESPSPLNGAAVNVASGRATSLAELVRLTGEVCDKTPLLEFRPERAGDIRDSVADVTRAKNILGFEPQTDLRAGLVRTRQWLESS